MPYLRWLETAHIHSSRLAIHDGERSYTFAELAARVDDAPIATTPVIARAGGVEFFVQILRGWRDGQVVIPIEREAQEPVLASPPPVGAVLVKHTPGASGIPRGIFFNASQVIADGDRISEALKLGPATPNLAVISLAHSYGFSNVVLPLFLHGVPVYLAGAPFPRIIEQILSDHGPMVVPAVPSMWRAWHRSGVLKQLPVSLALSAGAPLSLELERDVFAHSGLKIRNLYGASECGAISIDFTDQPRQSAEDVGTVLPGVILDRAQDGRLRVASDAVGLGYDSVRDDDGLRDGLYLTRDLGEVTVDGRVMLAGTIEGAINVAGRKISPAKVESAILATGLIRGVKIHGQDSLDPERVKEIVAEVQLREGVTLGELKAAASQKLQLWEMPRHWRVI